MWPFHATRPRNATQQTASRRRPHIELLEHRRVLSANFDWAFALGGATSAHDLALDSAGNTTIVGRFTGTVDFDPGVGTFNLTSTPAGSDNSFAAKYDASGNLLWASRFGGNARNFGPELATGSDGSVYVTGAFEGTADFGATILGPSVGSNDPFVAKLDADGNFLWARQLTGTYGNGVAVDGAGNVLVMAEDQEGANLDAIITKLDSSGGTQWTYTVGQSTADRNRKGTALGWARGFKIAVDGAGNVYGTGRMDGTVDFDPGTGTTKLSGTGAFVVKLGTAGNLTWARSFKGTIEPRDIAVDAASNVYTTGGYSGSVDFDPGTGKFNLPSVHITEAFVSKLNYSGDFAWAKSVSGLYTQAGEGLAVDAAGDVYVTGTFENSVDFDPGPGTSNFTSAGDKDAFVWKLGASGAFAWVAVMGGAGTDIGRGIGVDVAGNVYTAGSFSGTADFDPGPGAYNLTTSSTNLFVSKLVQSGPPAAASSIVVAAASNGAAGHDSTQAPRVAARQSRVDRAIARPRLDAGRPAVAASEASHAAAVDHVLSRLTAMRRRRVPVSTVVELD